MVDRLEIRESEPDDASSIERLYPDAFPDEDLLPLVAELLEAQSTVLSLVGIVDKALVGHVIFTTCELAGTTDRVTLLGPLAVAPARQRRGIGTALVREGLRHLKNAGTEWVFVLGDPAYYGRFGFGRDDGVSPPYPLPDEWHDAWQSLSLHDERRRLRGELSVPHPWQRRALWAP